MYRCLLIWSIAAKHQKWQGFRYWHRNRLVESDVRTKDDDIKMDAVEIDKDAFEQAATNFSASLWNNRLNLFLEDINLFKPEHQYEFIFSNPPFYENDLKSNDRKRNTAMHTVTLSYQNLLLNVDRLLGTDGIFAVLLPYAAEQKFIKQALNSSLFAVETIRVKQTTKHSFSEVLFFFKREQESVNQRNCHQRRIKLLHFCLCRPA